MSSGAASRQLRLWQASTAKVRVRNALGVLYVPGLEYDTLISRIAHLDTETYYLVAFDSDLRRFDGHRSLFYVPDKTPRARSVRA
jgi:hypothetical protein